MALLSVKSPTNIPWYKRPLSPLTIFVLLVVLLVAFKLLLLPTNPGPSHSKRSKATFDIMSVGAALDTFDAYNGHYPSGTNGLNDLVTKPAGTTNWPQYLNPDRIPLDPWGHPYLYVSPGLHNTNSYDLSSAGPDGIPGTPDDIVNWQQP